MASPALELQGAIVAALKASAPLTALISTRVYDHVPRGGDGSVTGTFPLVAIANMQSVSDDADCIDGMEITTTLDVWSRSTGKVEAHRIADAVKRALHKAELSLTDNALVIIEHESTLVLADPDGLTSHGILTFRAFVEEN